MKRFKIFLFFSIFFLVILFFTNKENDVSSLEGKNTAEILKQMPKRDRERLEYFFRTCITWEPFGYVLFGDKPMAFDGYEKNIHPFEDLSSFLYAICPRRIKHKQAVETWKKYEKLFPMERFTFIWEDTPKELLFCLICKKNFYEQVEQHQEDFEKVFHHRVSGEEILQEAMHRPLMSEVLFNHDGLIGTLLGFGRDNAFLVHEHGISKSDAEVDDLKQKFNFGNPWETEEMELDEKLESIGWINAFITGNHLKNLDLNPLPGFIAILDHPETLRLKESYLQTRKKMLAYYKGKDFLEATLLALTSEEEFF